MLDAVDWDFKKIDQICANCGSRNAINMADLQLGVPDGPDVIALPACACGTQEFLFRTWENVDGEHRAAVNAVAEHLRAAGKSHPQHAAKHRTESAPPAIAARTGRLDRLSGRSLADEELDRRLRELEHEGKIDELSEDEMPMGGVFGGPLGE